MAYGNSDGDDDDDGYCGDGCHDVDGVDDDEAAAMTTAIPLSPRDQLSVYGFSLSPEDGLSYGCSCVLSVAGCGIVVSFDACMSDVMS